MASFPLVNDRTDRGAHFWLALFTTESTPHGLPNNNSHPSYYRRFDDSKIWQYIGCVTCRVQNPDIPRAGRVGAHGGSGRGARRGGGAESGRTGCQQNISPRRRPSLVPSKASNSRRLNGFPEARTSEIKCKPNAGTKSPIDPRLTRGLSPVYHRDEKRSLFLAADQWTDAFLSL